MRPIVTTVLRRKKSIALPTDSTYLRPVHEPQALNENEPAKTLATDPMMSSAVLPKPLEKDLSSAVLPKPLEKAASRRMSCRSVSPTSVLGDDLQEVPDEAATLWPARRHRLKRW